tara:strand:+ start:812 stop:988 length:177 start_codon:yes stop_codon:yes gene_type:complete
MKKYILLLSFFSIISLGCDQIIPKIELRDNYQGKRLLEPDSFDNHIYRDNLGNPILKN